MGGLIEGETTGVDGVNEGKGLFKREAQTFACDGVDRAGGIAEQREVSLCDAAEFAGNRETSHLARGGLGRGEPGCKFRKVRKRPREAEMRIARE